MVHLMRECWVQSEHNWVWIYSNNCLLIQSINYVWKPKNYFASSSSFFTVHSRLILLIQFRIHFSESKVDIWHLSFIFPPLAKWLASWIQNGDCFFFFIATVDCSEIKRRGHLRPFFPVILSYGAMRPRIVGIKKVTVCWEIQRHNYRC